MPKPFHLIGPDDIEYLSDEKGELGGHRHNNKRYNVYGRMDCPAALNALAKGGYKQGRVFFRDEADAIAAGFRPCSRCMPERYRQWDAGGVPGTPEYPWRVLPK